jgi:hypothetical protein
MPPVPPVPGRLFLGVGALIAVVFVAVCVPGAAVGLGVLPQEARVSTASTSAVILNFIFIFTSLFLDYI